MKPLLPTLKEKKRYLIFEVRTAQQGTDCSLEILREIKRMLGLFGSAEAGLQMINYDKKKQQGVIRSSLKAAPKVRAALMMITKLERKSASIRVLGVSGILNKTERFKKI